MRCSLLWSSLKTTSSTQCREFLTPQCERTDLFVYSASALRLLIYILVSFKVVCLHFLDMEHKEDKKRNRGGRPKKEVTDKLKYRIAIKMTTEDYYLLKSKAKSAGVSASELIRSCVSNGGVKERLSKEHGDFIRKLCGMANNLIQLARKANAEGYTSVFIPCRTLMIEIDNLVNRIRL